MTITIYSKPNCTFCDKSKALVKGLGLTYEEKMFGKDFNSPEELYEAVGKQVRTMPQIKIDGELIGGYNQLVEYFVEKGKVNFKGERLSKTIPETNRIYKDGSETKFVAYDRIYGKIYISQLTLNTEKRYHIHR